jgi:energy-converting hydrogenase B subunit D
MTQALVAFALVWVAAAGTAVVLTRDPLKQAFVAGFFGLSLATLYVLLQAGDVALSQLVVGAVALPLIVLLSLAKVRKRSTDTSESARTGDRHKAPERPA